MTSALALQSCFRRTIAAATMAAAAALGAVPVQAEDLIVKYDQSTLLRLPRPASLSIEVVDAVGKPVAKQWVNVGRRIPRAPTWPAPQMEFGIDTVALVRPTSYETRTDGRLVREGLVPGRYGHERALAHRVAEGVEVRRGWR